MTTFAWQHNGTAWSDPADWSAAGTAGVPGPGDVALFAGDLFGEAVTGTATVGALVVLQDGPVLKDRITLATDRAALTIDGGGELTIADGGGLTSHGALLVGTRASGTLTVNGSPTARNFALVSGSAFLGTSRDGTGQINVVGGGWNLRGGLVVGAKGAGDVSVVGGGAVFVSRDVQIGQSLGATGIVAVTGSGAELFVTGTIGVGEAGTGALAIAASGYVTGGGLAVGDGSAVSLADGYLNVDHGATIAAGAVLDGSGSFSAATLDNEGVVTARGLLSVDATVEGAGALDIATAATLVVDRNILGLQHIAFVGGDATLLIEAPIESGLLPQVAADLSGFRAGDTIGVSGIDRITFDRADGRLSLQAQGHAAGSLTLVGLAASDTPMLTGHRGDLGLITLVHAPSHG